MSKTLVAFPPPITRLSPNMQKHIEEFFHYLDSLTDVPPRSLTFDPKSSTVWSHPNPWNTDDGIHNHLTRQPEDFQLEEGENGKGPAELGLFKLSEQAAGEPIVTRYYLEIPLDPDSWPTGTQEATLKVGLPENGVIWSDVALELMPINITGTLSILTRVEDRNQIVIVKDECRYGNVSAGQGVTIEHTLPLYAAFRRPIASVIVHTALMPTGGKLLLRYVSCLGKNNL